jgi:hypothetical protein
VCWTVRTVGAGGSSDDVGTEAAAAGSVRVLAMAGDQRLAMMPDVPSSTVVPASSAVPKPADG